MGGGDAKLGPREEWWWRVWEGGKSSVLDGDVVGCSREEEGETVKGYFCSSDERCLSSGTKDIKAGGGAEEGAVGTVFDKRLEGDEANMPKGSKEVRELGRGVG